MGSRAGSINSIERRLRRVAARHGLTVLKAEKPSAKAIQHGGYMLRDTKTFSIVLGNKSYEFSASIEDIEAFLAPSEDEA